MTFLLVTIEYSKGSFFELIKEILSDPVADHVEHPSDIGMIVIKLGQPP